MINRFSASVSTHSCIYALFVVFDEDGNLASAGRFEDLGELRNSLLKDLRWADIDFRYHNHDRHIERQSDTQMLSRMISALYQHDLTMFELTCSCLSSRYSPRPLVSNNLVRC